MSVKDRELLELMQASGADFMALGLESVSQDTLDHFEKSQTVDDIEHAIAVLHEYGIRSHGMFVLGAEHDQAEFVRDTVDVRPEEQDRHRDDEHPHAAPRHAAVRVSWTRRDASSPRTGACTTRSTPCSGRAT